MVEVADPLEVGNGRFGGALAFTATQGDHVAWPVGLATMPELTIELWAMPDGAAGTHAMVATSDGRVTLTVAAASPSTVVFAVSVVASTTGSKTYTVVSAPVASGAWHHVLASLQQPTLRLWVDAARTQVGGVDLGTDPALAAIQLGGTYGGELDEVWLAQTAITSDDDALARYCPVN
jgi:hypothetical protein